MFVLYVLMWSVQGLLVHHLQRTGIPTVSPVMIVTLQELIKLLVSVILYKKEGGSGNEFVSNMARGLVYIAPAGLYAVYNNLTFLGLSLFDPSRYFVLMQFRIVATGLLYTWCFPRGSSKLTNRKWIGLILIMVGAMLRETQSLLLESVMSSGTLVGYGVVGCQIGLSSLAGVANERLLKKKKCNLNLENIFMYSMSLLINLVMMGFLEPTNMRAAFSALSVWHLPVILNGAFLGIITSIFLRHLNSVLKSIASAIELWVTALASSIIFGYPMDISMVVGVAVLTLGVVIYSIPGTKRREL